MKRRLLPAVFLILAIGIISTALIFQSTAEGKSGELKYNGQTISTQNVTVFRRTAQVPFIEILKAAGADVVWLNEDEAVINCNGKKYQLTLSEVSLVEENDNFNLIGVAPGAKHYYCDAQDKEVILDIDTIRVALGVMDENVTVDISYKDASVLINSVS